MNSWDKGVKAGQAKVEHSQNSNLNNNIKLLNINPKNRTIRSISLKLLTKSIDLILSMS